MNILSKYTPSVWNETRLEWLQSLHIGDVIFGEDGKVGEITSLIDHNIARIPLWLIHLTGFRWFPKSISIPLLDFLNETLPKMGKVQIVDRVVELDGERQYRGFDQLPRVSTANMEDVTLVKTRFDTFVASSYRYPLLTVVRKSAKEALEVLDEAIRMKVSRIE